MENKKILIVDDDPDLTVAIKAILENKNYQVITAINKEEGWKEIKSENPDLLILDVMMDTSHEGFEMAREIKKKSEYKYIPILMLTSISEVTGVNFSAAASDPDWLPADEYLDKPVEPEELLKQIRVLLAEEE
ncbi:MAG: response regulator [Bacteroidetes bacterium 4484_249]|nr:MAG: response regulator [Bacteroidetes bacterium 4484_249]